MSKYTELRELLAKNRRVAWGLERAVDAVEEAKEERCTAVLVQASPDPLLEELRAAVVEYEAAKRARRRQPTKETERRFESAIDRMNNAGRRVAEQAAATPPESEPDAATQRGDQAR